MSPVQIRYSARARRWRLSVDRFGVVELCVPLGSKEREINRVLKNHQEWIVRHQGRQSDRFQSACDCYAAHPGLIPFLGEWIEPDDRPELFYRRAARSFFEKQCSDLCAQINRSVRKITITDPKTRWGSCSTRGNLSFSWRLMKASCKVASYVAAHECAHLAHPNHSGAFWALVASLHPDFEQAEQWLKAQSAFLHTDPWVSND